MNAGFNKRACCCLGVQLQRRCPRRMQLSMPLLTTSFFTISLQTLHAGGVSAVTQPRRYELQTKVTTPRRINKDNRCPVIKKGVLTPAGRAQG
jgi:hypothetical protein